VSTRTGFGITEFFNLIQGTVHLYTAEVERRFGESEQGETSEFYETVWNNIRIASMSGGLSVTSMFVDTQACRRSERQEVFDWMQKQRNITGGRTK
jgi:hypothetical protein